MFKRIGEHLMKEKITVEQCFDLIDDDRTQTISIAALKEALIRFELGVPQPQLGIFLERLSEPPNAA